MILRFRLSFGGRLLPNGKKVQYTLEEIRGARDRCLRAEGYLYHPEKLSTLRDNSEDLALVRDYLEQDIEADMALTDPPRFSWTVRGALEFLRLGLHKESPATSAPGTVSSADVQLSKLISPETDAKFLSEAANSGFPTEWYDASPGAFSQVIGRLEKVLRSGAHRASPDQSR